MFTHIQADTLTYILLNELNVSFFFFFFYSRDYFVFFFFVPRRSLTIISISGFCSFSYSHFPFLLSLFFFFFFSVVAQLTRVDPRHQLGCLTFFFFFTLTYFFFFFILRSTSLSVFHLAYARKGRISNTHCNGKAK